MKDTTFSISEAVKVGWQRTLANGWFLGGVLLVTWAVSWLMSLFQPEHGRGAPVLGGVISVLGWILVILLEIGFVRAVLKVLDGVKPSVNDFYSTFMQFVHFAVASLLCAIVVIIGFVVFIIPGIILALRLQFYPYFVVEHGLGPIAALKQSWTVSRGHGWHLFLFGLVLALIGLLGALAFGVGLLLAIPTSTIAAAFVYRKLSVAQPAAPAAAAA